MNTGEQSRGAEIWTRAGNVLSGPPRRRGRATPLLPPSTTSSSGAPLTFLASNILFSKT